MTITRTLAAALATAALAAPAAEAQPADMHAPAALAAAQQREQGPTQDRRSADAIDADMHASTAQAAAQQRPKWDLRSADAIDAARNPQPVSRPAQLPSGRPAGPQPVTPVPAVQAPDGGSGIEWTTIGLGIAGSLLAVSMIAALVHRSRRLQRPRVTA